MASTRKPGPKTLFQLEGTYPDPPKLGAHFNRFPEISMFQAEYDQWWAGFKRQIMRERELTTQQINDILNRMLP